MEMHMQAGTMWGVMDRNELCSSPRQLFQHLTMSILYFGHCSVPVPWLLWLLCCVTSLPCHHPHSQFLLISLLLIWGIYTQSARGIFDEFWRGCREQTSGNAACLPASAHTMQKRFSASAGHVSVCSGSFVLVTFSQLNENPPQRLMQPEAIWDVQAHLLSSLSHLPIILQSWQEGNKESRTQIWLSDPLSQGREFAHFLSSIPLSYGCL